MSHISHMLPTTEGKPAYLPEIPKNYGVSNKPYLKVTLILALIAAISLTLNMFSLIYQWGLWVTILTNLIIVGVAYLWWTLRKINNTNIQKTYKDKYIAQVLTPWFAGTYNLKLHPDNMKMFLYGIPVMIGENHYILTRYSMQNKKTYVASVTVDDFHAMQTNTIDAQNPRINLAAQALNRKEFLVPENYGYKLVDVEGKTVVLPVTVTNG